LVGLERNTVTWWVEGVRERRLDGMGLMLPILMLVMGTPAARATEAMMGELRSPLASLGVYAVVKLRNRVRVRVLV
jgi:hypothetical protein